jgi:hypothetical protein
MTPNPFDDSLHAIVEAFNKKLMSVVEENSDYAEKYYIIVLARQEPRGSRVIKQKILLSKIKPPMMLATMVYFVDQVNGKLSRLWTLPGDWPSLPSGSIEEPSPEIVSSIKKLGESYYRHPVLA